MLHSFYVLIFCPPFVIFHTDSRTVKPVLANKNLSGADITYCFSCTVCCFPVHFTLFCRTLCHPWTLYHALWGAHLRRPVYCSLKMNKRSHIFQWVHNPLIFSSPTYGFHYIDPLYTFSTLLFSSKPSDYCMHSIREKLATDSPKPFYYSS